MQVKVVYYIPIKRPYAPVIEDMKSEVIVVDDLVVIMWDSCGLHAYYKNMEHYLERRFEYLVEDRETDIVIVDLGDI